MSLFFVIMLDWKEGTFGGQHKKTLNPNNFDYSKVLTEEQQINILANMMLHAFSKKHATKEKNETDEELLVPKHVFQGCSGITHIKN